MVHPNFSHCSCYQAEKDIQVTCTQILQTTMSVLLLDASVLLLVLAGSVAITLNNIFESIFYYGSLHCMTTDINIMNYVWSDYDVLVVDH